MTIFADTPFARLESEGRLFNPVLKGPTQKDGRIGFRGEIALTFQQQVADEKRPPETTADQIIAIGDKGSKTIPFLSGYLHSFEYLKELASVLDGSLDPAGKYILFCNNIDLLSKYDVELDGIKFHILPIDEATVYNELLELLRLEKTDLKKLSTAGKTDAVADAALSFNETFKPITFEEGLGLMGPVRNRNENRPV